MKPKSNFSTLALISFVIITSGCASITGTTIQSVSVQTRSPDGKEVSASACELANNKGKWFITTPGSVTVTRSNDDMQILCTKQGLEPGRASVVSWTKGSMFGNILLGGGIGAIIDHNNGTAYEYPASIQVVMGTFTKIEPPETKGEQAPNEQPDAQPIGAQKNTALSVQTSTPAVIESPPREEKLRELKKLYDAGLISQEVYMERQRKLLE